MDHFLGRSDSMVRLRGINVYPMACLPAVKSDPRNDRRVALRSDAR